jgi:thioredoxin-related protein
MIRKLYTLVFTFLISGLTIFLLSRVFKKEGMSVGADLPVLEIQIEHGQSIINQKKEPLLIVYFSTSCEHCRYQLNVFNLHIKEFKNIELYFLTSESDFFAKSSGRKWEELSNAANATFGIIEKDTFRELFGSAITPSLFFFDAQGKLKDKIRGEVKLQKIQMILQSLMSGQTQSAATNNVP